MNDDEKINDMASYLLGFSEGYRRGLNARKDYVREIKATVLEQLEQR